MAKPRRKPSHPPDIIAQIARRIPERKAPVELMMPVAFIETEAQNAGCVVETIREEGKARRKRRYRLHVLERMAKETDGLMRITERQKLAGMALHDAWCGTLLSPPAVREIVVDSTPRPDDLTVHQVIAMQRYADLIGVIPRQFRPVARHVACENRALRDGMARDGMEASGKLAELQVALDLLANHLGY